MAVATGPISIPTPSGMVSFGLGQALEDELAGEIDVHVVLERRA